jgi:hypothetical protein
MLMPSREKIEKVLRAKGVDPAKLATDARNVDRAVGIVHGMIPIPFRWIVGKGRVRSAVLSVIRQRVSPGKPGA